MKTLISTYIILLISLSAPCQVQNLLTDSCRNICDSLTMRCELLQYALSLQAAEVDSVKSQCADAVYEFMLQVDSLQRQLRADTVVSGSGLMLIPSTGVMSNIRALRTSYRADGGPPADTVRLIGPQYIQSPYALAACYGEISGYRDRINELQIKSTTYIQLLFICLAVMGSLMVIIFIYLLKTLKK